MSWAAAGVASAGLNLNAVSQWWNRKEQRRQNQWGKDYADFSYYRERNDALADRDHFEEYNDPSSQMYRMRKAGLNPALMYGQGSVGETDMPRPSKPDSASSQPAAQIDVSGMQKAMENFFTILQTEQQTDNLQAQADLLEKQNWIMEKQGKSLDIGNESATFDLEQRRKLGPTALESAAINLESLKTDVELKKQALQLNLDANERAQLANSTNVQKTLEEIRAIRQKRIFELSQQPNIAGRNEAELKKLNLELNQLESQIALLKMTNHYAERDIQLKQLLMEFEIEIKAGGGSIGGILSKIVQRLRMTLSPKELEDLKNRYPLLF